MKTFLVTFSVFCIVGLVLVDGLKHAKHGRKHHQKQHTKEEPISDEFQPHIEDLRTRHVTDDVSQQLSTEVWAYVEVRPGAHMFWWLYYTYHPDGHLNRPIIIWLQGGPGSSSTGYGNFEVGIGPLDLNLEPRNTTWVQEASILFIDQPVGTGYSYVESNELFTNTTEEIAEDLYICVKTFLAEIPDFQDVPLYIFGQSYGGKMGAAAARRFHRGVVDGDVSMNLAGFAMGNAWIHPVDSTVNWGPFLYWMSNLDEDDLQQVNDLAGQCKAAADRGDWVQSTQLWRATEYLIWNLTNFIDFYNVLNYVNVDFTELDQQHFVTSQAYNDAREAYLKKTLRHMYDLLLTPDLYDELDDLMNDEIREKLGIIPDDVIWGGQSDLVFEYQEGDFMKPVVDIVGEMLNTTDMDVIVYQGQLDLICLTKGANDWVLKLRDHWDGLDDFLVADRYFLTDPFDGETDTFIKATGKFKYYWMILAGHAVPKDDGEGALRMLQRIIDKVDV